MKMEEIDSPTIEEALLMMGPIVREKEKAYRVANRDRDNKSRKKWELKNKAHLIEYRASRRDKTRIYQKAWYATKKGKAIRRASGRAWYAANKDRLKALCLEKLTKKGE